MPTPTAEIIPVILSFSLSYSGISYAGINMTTDANLFRLELEPDPSQPVVERRAPDRH